MTHYGYSLVSPDADDTQQQHLALRSRGVLVEHIVLDAYDEDNNPSVPRTALTTLLSRMRPGDILAVPALGRLAVSGDALEKITESLIDAQILIDTGNGAVNPANSIGRTLWDTLTDTERITTS